MTSLQFRKSESAHDVVWFAFWTLQAADVWTTQRGMDYNCVFEQNPLLPKVPHLDRLIAHKIIFLHPFYFFQTEDVLTQQDMLIPTLLGAYVIHSNLRVIKRAKRNCSKR